MIDFTTVVGVDRKTLEQLRWSHVTWRAHAPEIWASPMMVFFDRSQVTASEVMFLEHPNMSLVEWPPDGCGYESQREKMLSGFVHVPKLVRTPWWMKLDTDAVRTRPGPWMDRSWFEGIVLDHVGPCDFAFIGNRWGYTKPGSQMRELDDWGDKVEGLSGFARLDLPVPDGARVCRHEGGRMASWIAFFHTAWSKMVAEFCVFGHIPVPSEDGFHWYCAARRHDPYKLVKFKRLGWTNCSRMQKLQKTVAEAMQ